MRRIAILSRILSDLNPSRAAAHRNIATDDCAAAVTLERIEPDGSPTRPFPPHRRNTGQGWSILTVYEGGFGSVVRLAPAIPTAPSARSGAPVKHAEEHQYSDDEPPELVSGEPQQFLIAWTDYMGGMVREFDRKVTQGPPVLCAAHVQYLGRGPSGNGAHCINNAAEVNNWRLKDQRKAEAGAPPVPIAPIPELDTKRLVSSKASYTSPL